MRLSRRNQINWLSEVGLASLFPVFVKLSIIDELLCPLVLTLFFFLFVIIVFFFLPGSFSEVLKYVFFVGVWVNTKKITRSALHLILPESSDLDFVRVLPSFLLISISPLSLFKLNFYRFRLSYANIIFFFLERASVVTVSVLFLIVSAVLSGLLGVIAGEKLLVFRLGRVLLKTEFMVLLGMFVVILLLRELEGL